MKLFTIGEFAKYCGTTVEFLKYYDREGLISPIWRDEAGRRCYASYQTVDFAELYWLSRLGIPLKQAKLFHDTYSLDDCEACLLQRKVGLQAEVAEKEAALAYLDNLLFSIKNIRQQDRWYIQPMKEAYFCLPNTASSQKMGVAWWKYDIGIPELWQCVSRQPNGHPVSRWGSMIYDHEKIDSELVESITFIPAGRCFTYWYSVPIKHDEADSQWSDDRWKLEEPLSIMTAHNLVPRGELYQRKIFITHEEGRPFAHFMARIPLK